MLLNMTKQLIILILIPVQSILAMKFTNHSCYVCVEPLVGYTDPLNSCRFLNVSSPVAASYVQQCNDENVDEYECRTVVVSYRSVETYLRRDCAPKGLCSWKDKTQSMIDTPVSDCVFTDNQEQKLECIYCCDTPLCNDATNFVDRGGKKLFFVVALLFLLKDHFLTTCS